MNTNDTRFSSHPPRRNTIVIWLCAAGLSTALLAFALLLGLITLRGMAAFYPQEVFAISLHSTDEKLFGIILSKGSNDLSDKEEWQILNNNSKEHRSRFSYILREDIREIRTPGSIAMAKRLSGGPLFFSPLSLTHRENGTTHITDDAFSPTLRRALKQSKAAQRQIQALKRDDLPALTRTLNALSDKKDALRRQSLSTTTQTSLNRVEERIKQVREDALTLQEEIARLQNIRANFQIEAQFADGSTAFFPLSDFSSIDFPNTMGPSLKAITTLGNIARFLSEHPRQANTAGGIFPAIFSTFVMTLLMSVIVMPFGVIAAVYLREYAKQGPFVQTVRIGVNNLAGVPSIVYGVFGLGFFVYIIGGSIDSLLFADRLPNATFGTGGILWASLTLALMTLPVVIVATEEALAAVPKGTREASIACGASQLQTLLRVVLPASGPGIMTGLILAIARGAGEVAPLMLVGVVKLAPELPIDENFPFFHLDRKFMHLGFHIYDLAFQSPQAELSRPFVFATTLLLILLVIFLNLAAVLIRRQLRARLHSSAF